VDPAHGKQNKTAVEGLKTDLMKSYDNNNNPNKINRFG
jgi:hypothetical protein